MEGERGVRVLIAGCEKSERRIARGMIHRKIWGRVGHVEKWEVSGGRGEPKRGAS